MAEDFTEINRLLRKILEQTKMVGATDMSNDLLQTTDDMALINANAMIERQQMRITELESKIQSSDGGELFGKLEEEVTRLTDLTVNQRVEYELLMERCKALQEDLSEEKADVFHKNYETLMEENEKLETEYASLLETNNAMQRELFALRERRKTGYDSDPSKFKVAIFLAVSGWSAFVMFAVLQWWYK